MGGPKGILGRAPASVDTSVETQIRAKQQLCLLELGEGRVEDFRKQDGQSLGTRLWRCGRERRLGVSLGFWLDDKKGRCDAVAAP